jgi:hypothetical protein
VGLPGAVGLAVMKVRRLVPVAFIFFRSSCVLLRHEPSGVLSFLRFLIGSFRQPPRRSFLVSFVFLVGFGSAKAGGGSV